MKSVEKKQHSQPLYQFVFVLGLRPFVSGISNFLEAAELDSTKVAITSTSEDQVTLVLSGVQESEIFGLVEKVRRVDPTRLLYYGVALQPSMPSMPSSEPSR